MNRLFCFGLGYCAGVLSRRLTAQGWSISGTATTADKAETLKRDGYEAFVFDGCERDPAVTEALSRSTHILLSIPPDADGDPALRVYGPDIAASPSISWIGYFSSVSVYGDSKGKWVDEKTPPEPVTERGKRRLDAENAWSKFGRANGKTIVILRLPGIYGPGRSAIDQLRAGKARRIFKPGQVTNRVHVDDIATATEAALELPSGVQVFNVTDDLPAPPQDVIAYGAELLGVPCPPATDPADASLSPMARSFYAESKKVSNVRMKDELGVKLAYPTYVEGLKAIAGL
ncbi:NAD-dependent epimerase/dehydratase [Hyphomicrobium denitrificans 1NES1]|uniref:NAD-dependent epimerase/dehydratase n=1 Tax=Hyphomicrobium denitrificans 1NES1 TaxID=670307 RepID=N0AZL5_9HYPH|nr:SDR family oxidoreductase [Hyphomicrobium denitrificans]AGK56584.1 NAD-dependent epimerase/dehydratase [Hyphomicrobium denitrificans 1NES1]